MCMNLWTWSFECAYNHVHMNEWRGGHMCGMCEWICEHADVSMPNLHNLSLLTWMSELNDKWVKVSQWMCEHVYLWEWICELVLAYVFVTIFECWSKWFYVFMNTCEFTSMWMHVSVFLWVNVYWIYFCGLVNEWLFEYYVSKWVSVYVYSLEIESFSTSVSWCQWACLCLNICLTMFLIVHT